MNHSTRGRARSASPWCCAALLALSVLTGCGSGLPDIDPDALEPPPQSAPADDQDAPSSMRPIEFLLPEESDTPNGFQVVPAACDSSSGANEYRSWYSFAVPEGWEASGRTGGSTAPLDEGTTVSFGSGSIRSSVEVQSDAMSPDGSIGDGSGGTWTTFDYDYSVGDTSGTVQFEEVSTVSFGGQDATILAAPHEQDPEFLKVTEYKARLEVAHRYDQFLDGRVHTETIVVTITPATDARELEDVTVEGIVGSFALPACGRERIVVEAEATTQQDIDGDGTVATIEDYQNLQTGLAGLH